MGLKDPGERRKTGETEETGLESADISACSFHNVSRRSRGESTAPNGQHESA